MITATETIAKWGPPRDKVDGLWEFANGQWKVKPRMGTVAGFLAFELAAEVRAFAKRQRLGVAMMETLFRLSPEGPARRPNIAFIAYGRWTFTGQFTEDQPAVDVVPNLAVEVNSPTNTLEEIHGKVHDYFFHGVQLVWVVLPCQRFVYVYESLEDVRGLSDKRELTGGVVLPGFRLPLAELFGAAVKPT
jgi:Uma2 family endonuclease